MIEVQVSRYKQLSDWRIHMDSDHIKYIPSTIPICPYSMIPKNAVFPMIHLHISIGHMVFTCGIGMQAKVPVIGTLLCSGQKVVGQGLWQPLWTDSLFSISISNSPLVHSQFQYHNSSTLQSFWKESAYWVHHLGAFSLDNLHFLELLFHFVPLTGISLNGLHHIPPTLLYLPLTWSSGPINIFDCLSPLLSIRFKPSLDLVVSLNMSLQLYSFNQHVSPTVHYFILTTWLKFLFDLVPLLDTSLQLSCLPLTWLINCHSLSFITRLEHSLDLASLINTSLQLSPGSPFTLAPFGQAHINPRHYLILQQASFWTHILNPVLWQHQLDPIPGNSTLFFRAIICCWHWYVISFQQEKPTFTCTWHMLIFLPDIEKCV